MDGDHTRHKRSPAELRRSERILRADQIAFRDLTKADATAYCGCSEDAFDTWGQEGRGARPRYPALRAWIAMRLTGIWTRRLGYLPGRPRRTTLTQRWQSGGLNVRAG